jgi:hypothetical protein
MRNKLFILLTIFLWTHLGEVNRLYSQSNTERINAQSVLAKLDEAVNLGNGLIKANLILIRRTGSSDSWKTNIFQDKGNVLYLFERKGRGLETKLLSLDEGDKIFVFNTVSSKLFRKAEDEKYEIFQNTGFSYIDLSGYLYQANYDPIMNGEINIGDKTYWRVGLKPILPYEYKKLILLVNKDDLSPVRIDFHDRDGVLFKTLNIKYSPVKVKTNTGTETKTIAARFEMLDLNTGSIGVLEIREKDETVRIDTSLFNVENIGR